MQYRSIFVTSTTHYAQVPIPGKRMYVLTGRSNVGKSSLINMLLARKKLARVSGKPGKTPTINHYLINDAWCLVDLPGYGWAQQSKDTRQKWARMIQNFLAFNPYISYVFLLIDSRHPPQQNDLDFLDWLLKQSAPCALVFTKTDKDKSVVPKHINAYKKHIQHLGHDIPCFTTSAKTKQGREQLLGFIEADNRLNDSAS